MKRKKERKTRKEIETDRTSSLRVCVHRLQKGLPNQDRLGGTPITLSETMEVMSKAR